MSLWTVGLAAACVVVLISVMVITLVHFYKLRQFEVALKNAWGCDPGAMASLTINDSLPRLPAAADVVPTTYSADLSRILADHVARVQIHGTYDTDLETPDGATLVATFESVDGDGKPTFGVAWTYLDANGETSLVLAFRATITDREKAYDQHIAQEYLHGSGGVHRGFLNVLMKNRDAITTLIAKISPACLHVCGHSLGGAMSVLLAYDLSVRDLLPPKTVVYVYGAPRVGDPNFAAQFRGAESENDLAVWRETNQADIITTLPFPVTPDIDRGGQALQYEHVGEEKSMNVNWGSLKRNHLLSLYIEQIDARIMDES